MNPDAPTIEGFVEFIRESMRIGDDVIADDSPYIVRSFGVAMAWVNTDFACIPIVYQQAVYNFAASTLIRIAQDPVDFDPTQFVNSTPGANEIGRTDLDNNVTLTPSPFAQTISQTVDGVDFQPVQIGVGADKGFETERSTRTNFWENIRKHFGVNIALPGLIQSTSDQGDSVSYAVADYVKSMSAMDLKMSRDPYGQEYLNLAQQYGSMWGLS